VKTEKASIFFALFLLLGKSGKHIGHRHVIVTAVTVVVVCCSKEKLPQKTGLANDIIDNNNGIC
jgi:hypothetical protein